jgi:septum formation protein
MKKKNPIILASQSPRRKQLLELADVHFEVIVRNTDEKYPEKLPVEDVPVYIATQKALAVQKYLQKGNKNDELPPILAADTVVILGDTIIGKPKNKANAISILQSLAGKKHKVITGVALLVGNEEYTFSDVTEVSFHKLNQEDIEYYINKHKPFDKAGAYAIQEWIGAIGIQSIKGDFYNVMGLPVSRVVQLLKEIQN